MKKIFYKDITEKKEFDRVGYHYTCIKSDNENHIYLYEMHHIDKELEMPYMEYELVKGVKKKNPDGNIVYAYPNDEQFGTYGWFICGKKEYCKQKINEKYRSLVVGNGNKTLSWFE